MPVFHIDIEAVLAAVERIKDGSLVRRPFVIASDRARAVVLAASPDAKQLGIARHMPADDVRKFFPGVAIRPPDEALYRQANSAILEIVNRYSPVVEPMAYGHIAMDMTGMRRLFGSLENAAYRIHREIGERTSLQATVGIAANKLVSTIAAKEVQKAGEALCQVAPEAEPVFLAPLACRALPEWEDRQVRRLLFELNLRRIEQVQAISRDLFSFALGDVGTRLHRHAQGIDPQPVMPPLCTPQLADEMCFVPDTNDDEIIRAAIYACTEKLCSQLRAKGLASRQALLSLKYTDDVCRRRGYRFGQTQAEQEICRVLFADYERFCDRRRRVRHLQVSLLGLYSYRLQPSLFERPKSSRLAPHLDAIRRRFGDDAVRYGKSIRARSGAA